ncbi:MAG: M23 family metallopeptidase [Tenericutes bacterium]|nr:M23 family metallopeptidase [Mycoplasmatota bacterium]
MNKKDITISTILFGLIIIIFTVYVSITFVPSVKHANKYYKVYLGGEKIGLISSEEELYNLIDKEQKVIKDKYNVDKVYPPSGLKIQSVLTYSNNTMSAKEVYDEIKDLDPFTIEAYEVNVKKDKYNKKFFILNKEDLDKAIKNTILAFLTEEQYENYKNDTQIQKAEENMQITDIYFDQEVTIRKTHISTEEDIITSPDELSIFFLFGTSNLTNKYIVKATDTIEEIAYKNKLGVSDFLVANPNIVSEKALLAVGQEVIVAGINPIANIVVESFQTEKQTITYDTKVEYDKSLNAEDMYIKQQGTNGQSIVTYATKEMNGVILNTVLISEEVVSAPVDKIVVYGGKNIVYVGNSTYWAWPTSKPYRISSSYGYRVHPVYGGGHFHYGVDITGTPNKNIYAIQSGKVIAADYNSSMGYYTKIDHQNGYVSTYMHFAKKALVSVGETVEKGQLIGIMGSTGASTGRHLDFRIQKNGQFMNPLSIYQ